MTEEQITTENPQAEDGVQTMAKAQRHHEELLGLFEQSIEQDGLKAYERWGMSMFHSLSDEAAEAQRMEFGIAPADALGYYNRGCLLAAREDYVAAAEMFSEATKLDPEFKEARYNRALALERTGDKAAAKAAWEEHLQGLSEGDDVNELKQHLTELTNS